MTWLNVHGLTIVLIVVAMEVFYNLKKREKRSICINQVFNFLKYFGKYTSYLFMSIYVAAVPKLFLDGILEIVWLVAVGILLLAMLVVIVADSAKSSQIKRIVITVLPVVIFMFTGVMSTNIFLICSSLLYALGGIYIDFANLKF